MGRRIHITGASGCGVSTLGRRLADRLASQAFDTDDFFWIPSDPPFQDKRPVEDRVQLMKDLFLARSDWILSGSLMAWGEPVMRRVTHVIFLSMPGAPRLARLRARERKRYGPRIAQGGDRAQAFKGFLDWAAGYDDPAFAGRSRVRHEAWLADLSLPVIRLDATQSPENLVQAVVDALDHQSEERTG